LKYILLFQLTRLIPEAKATKCNVELEPIHNTRHSTILRVPFRTEDGKDLPHWVSRFDIYPYLERYAEVCITLFIPCLSFQKKNIHSLLTGIVYAFISSNSIIYSFLFGTG